MHVGIDGDILLFQASCALEARGYIGYDDESNPIDFSRYKKEIDAASMESYRAVELEDVDSVLGIYDSKVSNILRKIGTKSYTIYFTGKGNFRHDVYPDYKSSRLPKPLLYKYLREYAETSDRAVVVHGQEADDALAIAQYKNPKHHIIATIDKDLLMVPGFHYNFNKDKFSEVTKEEGLRTFYKQILTGDRVDDIPGIKGIGPKTAEKKLNGLTTEGEMWAECIHWWLDYLEESREDVIGKVTTYAQLLWMRSFEGELWKAPTV